MAKKFIGIDIDPRTVRIATAERVTGAMAFTGAMERRIESAEEWSRVLAEMLGDVAFGDRVVTCLHSVGSYYRLLEFPFGEAKKIAATLDLEMSSQLPTNDELVCDFLSPRPGDHVFEVPAAAVKRAAVAEMLNVFQQSDQSLHMLDLSPFAYAAGLAEAVPEGVLAVLLSNEITVAHIKAGQVVSFRSMPRRQQDNGECLAAMIQRDYLALAKGAGAQPLGLFLIGEGAGKELLHSLEEMGLAPRYPKLEIDGRQITPALQPAAALALRGALSGRVRQFNFLKGDLAPKNEWAGLRLRIIAIAALIGLSVIMTATGAYLNYVQKQKRAELLRQEILTVFRQTFPEIHTIVDVPSQMRGNLDELRERSRLLGLSAHSPALNVLREISDRIPKEVGFEVREMVYNADQVHIDGNTSSFEAINRLSQALDASPLFEQSQITDAKMGLKDGRIDFRLDFKISAKEPAQ
jgi:general secretion pathway protein L